MREDIIHIVSVEEQMTVKDDIGLVFRVYGVLYDRRHFLRHKIMYFVKLKRVNEIAMLDVTNNYHPLKLPISLN